MSNQKYLNESLLQGKLSLVATPIGNLEDITYRAIRVLTECDYIVCEDTRVTNNLLNYYNIKSLDEGGLEKNKSMITFHANSSEREIEKIMDLLKSGYNLAYVSDAGTPTISDPGVLLVNKIREYNSNLIKEKGQAQESLEDFILLESIPGVSAVTMAYSLSGAAGNGFTFYGFVPHKKGRETLIKSILKNEMTSIVYESVHRVEKLLDKLKIEEENLNIKKEYVICRELTKLFEDVIVGDIDYCINYFKNNQEKLRGEFVVIVK